ncbi:MAG: DUF1002 domain-containing protein [Lachnospiraceae bacterium]|nr:DUF1002 domain-containing protein [Lachnospiraceae bacterium]
MIRSNRRKIGPVLALCMGLAAGIMAFPLSVRADAVGDAGASVTEGSTCVSLGADLTDDQKAVVLGLLGLTEEDLAKDTVVTVTNEEEHKYLDSYLDTSVIGDASYSSSRVTAKGDGYGIQVTTQNITYCTSEMYQNALATAGVQNAEVAVAAPFDVTGTAALVGMTEAYSKMTGEALKAENVNTAADELVTTGKIAEEIKDPLKASELIAAVKGAVADRNAAESTDSSGSSGQDAGTSSASENLSDDALNQIIDETCQKLGITLTDQGKGEIRDLMRKFAGLNLNTDELKSQASSLYDKLASHGINIGLNKTDSMTIFDRLLDYIKQFQSWLKGLS